LLRVQGIRDGDRGRLFGSCVGEIDVSAVANYDGT